MVQKLLKLKTPILLFMLLYSMMDSYGQINPNETIVDIDCFGNSNGSIDLSPSDGTAPYSFSWTGPSGFTSLSKDISGLIAGTYTVEITDSSSTPIVDSIDITITQPSDITFTAIANNPECFGELGTVTLASSGGTGALVYTGSATTGLTAGTYNYTVIDANGCTATASATIAAAPSVVTGSGAVASEISCFGLTDGSITISFGGGTSPYDVSGDYTATDVTADQTHSGLAAGTYNYTITDANGCTATASATIAAAPSVVTASAIVTDVDCNGNSIGVINLTVTGGSTPYTYAWTGTGVTATAEDQNGLMAGAYSVTVMDANNCQVTVNNITLIVTDSTPPTITCPENITVDNDAGLCGAVVNFTTPLGADNCAVASVTQTAGLISGSIFPIGNTTITFEVEDTNGIKATCSFDVTVVDNEAPVFNCATLSQINLTTDPSTGCENNIFIASAPQATDNCNVTITATGVRSDAAGMGAAWSLGTTTITWTFMDSADNSTVCSQDVVVVDDDAPTRVFCPISMSVDTDFGLCYFSFDPVIPIFNDNCGITGVTWVMTGVNTGSGSGDISSTDFNVGLTTIKYTAVDAAGLSVDCEYTITVSDKKAPIWPSLSVLRDECSYTVYAPTTTDNCSGSITGTTGDYSIPHTFNRDGNYTINWKFDDGNGNIIVVPQTIIIDDMTVPVPDIINLPDVAVVDCEVTVQEPTATDNCEGSIDGVPTDADGNDVDFPITTFGTTIITWTYDDRNGQITTQQQSVTLTKPPISGGVLLGHVDALDLVEFPPSNSVAITACPDDINPVTIKLSGQIGTIVRWEKFEAGSNGWDNISNTNNFYELDFDFSNTKSTVFRVLIQVGTCTEYSTLVNVHAIPPDVPPTLENNYFNVCMDTEISLVAYSGYTAIIDPSEEDDGQFDQGQFFDHWNPLKWKIDGEVAGVSFTGAANNTKFNNWSATNNHPVGTDYLIEYDSNHFKFAIAHGDYTSQDYIDDFPPGNPTTLETPIMSLIGLESPSFSFNQAWNLVPGDIALLELSLDGGLTYDIILQDIWDIAPTGKWPWAIDPGSTVDNYVFDTFKTSFDLSAYSGFSEIRIRWTFYGTSDESAWAIDNIALPLGGSPANEIEWTDGIGDPNENPLATGTLSTAFIFTPDVPGFHQYGATSLINGCRAYDPAGTALADVLINYAYAGGNVIYSVGECGENVVTLNAYDNMLSAIENDSNGAYDKGIPLDCTNCDDPGTMTPGKWEVVDTMSSCGGSFTFSDDTDPSATFTGDPGTYTLQWTVGPFGPDDATCIDEVTIQITNCAIVDFDGENDNVTFGDNYNLNDEFSIECWIKPDATTNTGGANKTIQTIISKGNASDFKKGYSLQLVGNTISFNWSSTGSISSPYPIDTNRWYHIAVTRESGGNSKIYRLYIDGIEVESVSGNPPTANNFDCILGAMDQTGNPPNKPLNYFSGWIDELRIWNVTLSEEQIHQMMNQEIKKDPLGANVYGEVIPIDINGLSWSSLEGYYRMDAITCGYLNPKFVGVDGKIRNITSTEDQTAPLPYISNSDGVWSNDNTWLRPTVWDPPNSNGVNDEPIEWNIVSTSNNISSGDKHITVLGLMVDSGELTIADPVVKDPIEANTGQSLWVTHYLKLDGSIDLVGESQLIQKPYWDAQYYESMLDESSTGFIERDQQGIMNSYAYNYWSPPVSQIGAGSNNTPVHIEDILMDGTNSLNPQPISFGGNTAYYFADVTPGTPLKVASAWIWKYVNKPNAYAESEFLGNDDGTISPSEGYTMKGTDITGSVDLNVEHQNYVYIGKPNNVPFGVAGTPLVHTKFAAPADPDFPFISLTGNPFPSALDADQFLLDNASSTNETLYFWEHWANGTHQWALYQGGYAIYKRISGGTPAVDHPDITSGGTARNTPGRYVPVGQGFYVISSDTGGDVVFKNSQRFFERENEHTGTSSVFIKGSKKTEKGDEKWESTLTKAEDVMRIRLGFESPNGYHRQVLAAFFKEATDGIDKSFDAVAGDYLPNDAFFLQEDQYFVIQAFGEFNEDREIPISIFIEENQSGGIQKFMIDDLENIPEDIEIYIKDNYNDGETYDIRNTSGFEISLTAGEHIDRFALVFKFRLKRLDEIAKIDDGVTIYMNNSVKEIVIQKNAELDFEQVTLFNYLGQVIRIWDKNINERNITLPVEVRTGVYIVSLETKQGTIAKKVLIN